MAELLSATVARGVKGVAAVAAGATLGTSAADDNLQHRKRAGGTVKEVSSVQVQEEEELAAIPCLDQ